MSSLSDVPAAVPAVQQRTAQGGTTSSPRLQAQLESRKAADLPLSDAMLDTFSSTLRQHKSSAGVQLPHTNFECMDESIYVSAVLCQACASACGKARPRERMYTPAGQAHVHAAEVIRQLAEQEAREAAAHSNAAHQGLLLQEEESNRLAQELRVARDQAAATMQQQEFAVAEVSTSFSIRRAPGSLAVRPCETARCRVAT